MSYILEALKKAQAERQLGNAPTIHAPQPVPAAQPDAAASRKPLFIGLGAGALVVALGALFLWQRGPSTPAPAPAPAAVLAGRPAATPGQSAAVPAPTTPAASGQGAGAASPLSAGAASNRLEVSAPPAPAPRPVHAAETPARPASPAAGRAGTDELAARAPARTPAAAATTPPAPAAAAPRPATAQAAAPAAEDSLPYLHQLPDTIQRDIPRVTFGGYMYSANPADRLLLVDKTLRHEGEEVGPGLVLEKLMPKAAVMNFRGIRYRVAY
jgi:general secretion pathway protein B